MQVTVQNENTVVVDVQQQETIVVEVDQGRAGRGIQNITYTEVSGQYFLIVTYTDGTTETLGPLVVTGGAAFLLGGATGSIPYQSAPNTTVFLPIGTQNQVVVAGATAPQYTSALTGLTVNNSAIGNTAPSTGAFTNLSASGTFALTGDQVQISEGGTGQTTANGAFNALAPSQTGNAGKYLKTDGTNSSWDQLDISTADITGTLPIANGGTGQTTANSALNALLPTQAAQSGKYLKTDGTNASWDQLDISTADITGVLPIANGGTGASTAPGARANLSAAILGTNNDITSMTGLTGGISTPDFVQFDTTATEANAVGKVYWDASQGTLDLGLLGGNVITRIGQTLVAYVTNAEAVTITKGQVVYLFGAQGDRATVKLASNLSDATSAKTFGVVAENITANGTGFVMCQGVLDGLNLGAFNSGDTLYLGATPGSLTATKPAAPNHLVYVGLVERANPGNGQLYVKVQNGYELDEIHDVQIINPQNGQTILYDASTSLWKNANLTAGSGISVTNGAASVTIGNTGVLSFSGGTTGLTPSTSTTGAVTLGGTLAIGSGGTGQTTANASFNALAPSQTGNAGKYLKSDGTNTSWDQVDISTSDITGILPVLNGGTGANNASDARTNLNAASQSTTISAGTGLTGGGDLSANRTLSIANTTVTAGAYGSASNTLTATVNAQGQLTALAATPIAIANTQISGLGTMSTQNSNSVTITGGSITGITDLAIADGGTGASDAPTARTNLGLGTSATLNAGVALGVATLDAGGTVPLSQLPASIQGGVSYQGSWDAATNTPTIVSSVGTKGYYYVVSVAGSTNINGISDWLPGDWIIFNGSIWQKIDNTDAVASVNGYTGVVVLNAADVGAAPTSRTITAGTGLTGGGDLSANRTISIANTTVAAGSYGSASSVGTFTVNGQGQLTAAASTPIAITNTQVSGLGTMSTQNANSVAITGGSITGITDLAVADGGTGASDAATARTNLGAAASATTISAGTGLTGGGDLSANRTLSIANTTVTAASYGSASSVGTFTVNAQGQLTAAASTPIAIANTQVSGLGTMSTQNANAVAITGGSVDGTTIGGTTRAAGSFTTLTLTNALDIANGGTGQTTANAAFNALAPSQTGNAGKYLTTDGTNTSWATNPLGTVTSVDVSGGTTGLTTSGGPITSSGTITLGGTLATTNGGTGLTSFTANGVVYASSSSALTTGSGFTFNGAALGLPSASVSVGLNTSGQFIDVINGDSTNAQRLRLTTSGTDGVIQVTRSSGTVPNLIFRQDASELMRLTSTGLGIGTSSPGRRLAVSNAGAQGFEFGPGVGVGSGNEVLNYNRSTNLYVPCYIYASTHAFYSGTAGGNLGLYQDASGNVGIGTGFPGQKLEVNGSAYLAGRGGTFALMTPDWRMYNSSSGNALVWDNYSTEMMRLSSAGSLGIGTTSPAAKLDVANASGRAARVGGFQFSGTTSSADGGNNLLGSGVYWNGSNLTATQTTGAVLQLGNGVVQFQTLSGLTAGNTYSYAPQLTLDSSGNLGIGTSSPANKFVVSNAGANGFEVNPTSGVSSGASLNGYNRGTSAFTPLTYTALAHYFQVGSSPATAATLDSSGNLGLGVTPSAWYAPDYRAFQLVGGGALYSNGGNNFVALSQNWFVNQSLENRYIATAAATRYRQSAGTHLWDISTGVPSAGGLISFSTAMTLDAAGALLVGMTSRPNDARIASSGPIYVDSAPYGIGNFAVGSYAATSLFANSGYGLSAISFGRYNGSGTYTSQVLIDPSGNLGVGTSSPIAKLTALGAGTINAPETSTTGASIQTASYGITTRTGNLDLGATDALAANIGGSLTFSARYNASNASYVTGKVAGYRENATSNSGASYLAFATTTGAGDLTERARINSVGAFKASTDGTYLNAAEAYHELRNSTDNGTVIATTNASQTANSLQVEATRTTTDNTFYAISYYNRGASAYRFRVADSGNVTNTNNSYGAISDIKLKENITDATPKLASLNQLRVVNYNFKGSDLKQIGLVAQEVEQVFPGLVETSADRDAEGNDLGTTTKSVKYSVLVPMLLKAVQELTAMNDDLRARVAQLEAK